MPWTSAHFVIDGLAGTFRGYTDGRTWNGWACPAFERDSAERIALAFCNQSGQDGPFEAAYDDDTDTFVFRDSTDSPEEDPLSFGSDRIKTVDGPRTLYFIGTSYWTWEEAEPSPSGEHPKGS